MICFVIVFFRGVFFKVYFCFICLDFFDLLVRRVNCKGKGRDDLIYLSDLGTNSRIVKEIFNCFF